MVFFERGFQVARSVARVRIRDAFGTNADGYKVERRGWRPLLAGSGKAIAGERVSIAQHPMGERMLLDWHRSHPVDEYERHRYWLTHRSQGNRNPFIDMPKAATNALLARGFG